MFVLVIVTGPFLSAFNRHTREAAAGRGSPAAPSPRWRVCGAYSKATTVTADAVDANPHRASPGSRVISSMASSRSSTRLAADPAGMTTPAAGVVSSMSPERCRAIVRVSVTGEVVALIATIFAIGMTNEGLAGGDAVAPADPVSV